MERMYLISENYDENIALWQRDVEQQTGKDFELGGASLCAAEELLETLNAFYKAGRDEFHDGIGDTYVATATVSTVILRIVEENGLDCGGPYIGHDLTFGWQFAFTEMAMHLVTIARKGLPALEKIGANVVLQNIADIRATCRTMGEQATGSWNHCINSVLDQLDSRLQDGYSMKNGTAIKVEDR